MFAVTHGTFGPFCTVVVSEPHEELHVEIALRGATLLRWRAGNGGPVTEFIDGYVTARELVLQPGVRSGVLAPFSNRIAKNSYQHLDTFHALGPEPSEDSDPVMHGFLRNLDTELRTVSVSADAAILVFHSEAIRPETFAGYPFALDIDVRFTITKSEVRLEITGTNVGSDPLPFTSGWHPYFRFGDGGIEHLTLEIPADELVQTDDSLIPFPGAAAWDDLDNYLQFDFRSERPINGAVLDHSFSRLAVDEHGVTQTIIRDPSTGRALGVWQQRGLMHVFTGDTLTRGARQSIALEPVEVPTNAFNRREYESAVTLAPGQTRSFVCGARILTPDLPSRSLA